MLIPSMLMLALTLFVFAKSWEAKIWALLSQAWLCALYILLYREWTLSTLILPLVELLLIKGLIIPLVLYYALQKLSPNTFESWPKSLTNILILTGLLWTSILLAGRFSSPQTGHFMIICTLAYVLIGLLSLSFSKLFMSQLLALICIQNAIIIFASYADFEPFWFLYIFININELITLALALYLMSSLSSNSFLKPSKEVLR